MLPKSPSQVERMAYVRSGRWRVYGMAIPSALCLLAGLFVFSTLHAAFVWYLVFAVFMTFYLGLSYGIGMLGKDFDAKAHEWERIAFLHGHYRPTVDVFLPTCGEDLVVLDNAYEAVQKLEYAFKKVFVLDDAGRAEVKRLAEGYGFEYIARPDLGVMKKAGNLRYAFARTNGEFILILDADFTPRADLLWDLLPHMNDRSVAIVQSPQYFAELSTSTWVEKGAIFIQEIFYRLVQVSRDTFGAAICCGSCALYRRTPLEPFGGTALIGYSEDMHTGFNVVDAGWRVKYVPLNLAAGVNPGHVSAFFSQQYRWAMGSLTLFFNPRFWKSHLSWRQKLCYLSGMLYYSATGVSMWLSPLPGVLMIHFLPESVHWYSVAAAIPSLIYSSIVMANWANSSWGIFVLRTRHLQGWAHVAALFDKLRGNLMPWVPTGTAQKSNRFVWWQRIARGYSLFLGAAYLWAAIPEIESGRMEILLPGALLSLTLVLNWFAFKD